jgi:hypothetical protein
MARGKLPGGPSWSPDPAAWSKGTLFHYSDHQEYRKWELTERFASASGESTVTSPFISENTLILRGFVLRIFGRTHTYKHMFAKGAIVCLLSGSRYPAILYKQGKSFTFDGFCTLYQDSITGEVDMQSGSYYLDTWRAVGDIMSGVLWNELINSRQDLRSFEIV